MAFYENNLSSLTIGSAVTDVGYPSDLGLNIEFTIGAFGGSPYLKDIWFEGDVFPKNFSMAVDDWQNYGTLHIPVGMDLTNLYESGGYLQFWTIDYI